MSMKLLCLFLFITIPFFALYSQNNAVDEINKYCEELNGNIPTEQNEPGNYLFHKIIFETNVRAIGLQITEVKFFYSQPEEEVTEDGEGTKFKRKYLPPPKVTVNYNIAASEIVSAEYYYRNGNLVLYHSISKGAYYCTEENYYYDNNKLVKVKVTLPADCKDKETLESRPAFERSDNFSKTDLRLSDKHLKTAAEYKKIFDNLVELEKLGK